MVTAAEDNAATWEDENILERASQLGRSVYTQDEDFLVLARHWSLSNRDHDGIIYAHQLSITIGEAVADLELIAKAMELDDMRNQVVFIPFR